MSQAIYETNSKKHDLMAKYYDGRLWYFEYILRKKTIKHNNGIPGMSI